MTAPLRVMVLPAWDTVTTDYQPDQSIEQLKRSALSQTRVMTDPAEFEIKFRGAALRREDDTVAAAGIPAGGSVIVLRRRRTPVR